MQSLVLLCINQYTKFEVSSFTNFKDMIGAKIKKTGHVTLTTPLLGVVYHPQLWDLIQSTCTQNFTILISAVPTPDRYVFR